MFEKKDKAALRAHYSALRETLRSREADEALARAFFGSPFARRERFFLYLSFRTEADTMPVIEGLLASGKHVCVPRVEGGSMSAVPYTGKTERGAFGILQPAGGEDTPCEVALVPLLAFDAEGFRLGYGGGYYDRYFASHPAVLRVGFAYAGQEATALLPREGTDIPLHAVITERGVRTFSPPGAEKGKRP